MIRRQEVSAVDLNAEEPGKTRNDLGNASAGRLLLDRDGNGEAVVLDQEDDGRMGQAFMASQNSPSLVAPSPEQTSVTTPSRPR